MKIKYECSVGDDEIVRITGIFLDSKGEEIDRNVTKLSIEKAKAVAEFINQLQKGE